MRRRRMTLAAVLKKTLVSVRMYLRVKNPGGRNRTGLSLKNLMHPMRLVTMEEVMGK